jgi:hypothetical protein
MKETHPLARRRGLALLAASVLTACVPLAHGQAAPWPTKPIRLIPRAA